MRMPFRLARRFRRNDQPMRKWAAGFRIAYMYRVIGNGARSRGRVEGRIREFAMRQCNANKRVCKAADGPRGLKLNEKSMRALFPERPERVRNDADAGPTAICIYVSVREHRSRDPSRPESGWPFAQIKIWRLCKSHGVEIPPED